MTRYRNYSDEDNYYTQNFESDGVVSVWLGLERPETESDSDALQECCGVGYYDSDNQEAYHLSEVVGLNRLLSGISYSDSFASAAIESANSIGITSAYWILVQFDFAYDPTKVTRLPTGQLVFLGTFPYVATAA